MAQLVVLLNAAARIGAAVVALCEVAPPAGVDRPAAIAEVAHACRAVAGVLLDGKGEPPLADLRRRLGTARAEAGTMQDRADLLASAQALRHFDNAEEALCLLFEGRRRFWELSRLPFAHRLPKGAVIDALRTHLTPCSAIFRHAVRVAGVTAVETAGLAYFRLPRGIWLPMTSLVVMQPDYGAIVARALQRTLGTILSAVLAAVLLATRRGTALYDGAIGLLLFATFLLIRRHYSYGITFLTPLTILLIGISSADPWIDLAERVAYAGGGRVARARRGLPHLAALGARAAARPLPPRSPPTRPISTPCCPRWRCRPRQRALDISALRRPSEIAVPNADAGFQRMLAEPAARRRSSRPASLSSSISIGSAATRSRLRRNLASRRRRRSRFAISGNCWRRPSMMRLRRCAGRSPVPRPDFDAPLAKIGSAAGDAVALLLGLVSDTTSLLAATAAAAGRGSKQ